MDTIALRTYALIVEEGSFSAAADRLGISRSMCSKHINDIEANLGARLLTRTTRSVKPTGIGLDYYAKVRKILDLLDEANESVKTETNTAAGRLKIGAPVSYTLSILRPHLVRFMRDYPAIQLEVSLDDKLHDMISEGYDAVIRVGELEDTSMHARQFHHVSTHVVASPGYLEENGTPEVPSDLSHHRTLYYANMRGAGTWPFKRGEELFYQKIHPVFSANNGELIATAALDGLGIAFLPDFLVREHIQEGRLKALLCEYSLPDIPISVVYPSRRNASAALKAFIDFCAPRAKSS
ncbi:LysR family transcriptional regulator [Pseudooceanicola sp. CBS1P-1]|uniref:LysR family transcriptional regulator n=1 Tax=Pseudooceanicola albus TaxID=2692189 RepID=A0A6L7G7N0_9RHOB|nr:MULTISPECIES: LysR family transcriptional regulator [Pseudooceanicola]MBT9384333.1 LysR family transcriptional regulator [Pseudooceanicola endophyticus]MXN19929.1 LysR family transcriptional regulator [Pseudooceanicola albus]